MLDPLTQLQVALHEAFPDAQFDRRNGDLLLPLTTAGIPLNLKVDGTKAPDAAIAQLRTDAETILANATKLAQSFGVAQPARRENT